MRRLSNSVVSVTVGFDASKICFANCSELPSVLGTKMKKAEKRTVASSSGCLRTSSNCLIIRFSRSFFSIRRVTNIDKFATVERERRAEFNIDDHTRLVVRDITRKGYVQQTTRRPKYLRKTT
jgi:hypothetical protein